MIEVKVNGEVAKTITIGTDGHKKETAIPIQLTQDELNNVRPKDSDNEIRIVIGSVTFTNVLNIKPPIATLSNGRITSKYRGKAWNNETFTFSIKSDRDTEALVTIGGAKLPIQLKKGEQSITLPGLPETWGVHSSSWKTKHFNVYVTPAGGKQVDLGSQPFYVPGKRTYKAKKKSPSVTL